MLTDNIQKDKGGVYFFTITEDRLAALLKWKSDNAEFWEKCCESSWDECWSNTFCSGTEQTTIEMNISSTQSKIKYQQWQVDWHDAVIGELKTLMVQILLMLYAEIAKNCMISHSQEEKV